jgi:uncharacterized membrane protein
MLGMIFGTMASVIIGMPLIGFVHPESTTTMILAYYTLAILSFGFLIVSFALVGAHRTGESEILKDIESVSAGVTTLTALAGKSPAS